MMNFNRSWITQITLCLICFSSFQLHGQDIRINELMASNGQTLADAAQEYDDWIEIYNFSGSSFNLAGYYLSDDPNKLDGNKIPAGFDDQTTIAPGGFLVIWADGQPSQGANHLSFKIKSGETVYLIRENNSGFEIIDEITLPNLATDYSYGRFPDGQGSFVISDQPSPGSANKSAASEPLAAVVFSEKGGFYRQPFYLELSCAEPNAEIYFTLDGSIPNQSDHQYTEPIYISDRSLQPNGLSTVKTTIDKGFSSWHEPSELIRKGTIIRAKAFYNDQSSDIQTNSFFIDSLKSERYSFPVFSVSLDSLALFEPDSGIYHGGNGYDGEDWETANFAQSGDEWERHAHLEFFEKGDRVLNQSIGVRISGNFTRTANQKSLRLYARSEYGNSKFTHRFFKDLDIDEFKRITLRNSGNDVLHAFMRDPFLQSLVKDRTIDRQASQPAILFLNGAYWGLHYIRERQDQNYLGSHYRIDPAKVDILEGNHEIVEGSDENYLDMIDFIESHDMSDEDNFSLLQNLMDVENFKKYLAIEFYIANGDWPYNNIKFWRAQTPGYFPDLGPGEDGRWRWMLFDTDLGMGRAENTPDKNTFEKTFTTHTSWQSRLIRNLVGSTELPGNQTYRMDVIRQMEDDMNTIFHPERVLPLIDEWAAMIEPEMIDQINRWGSIKSINEWHDKVDVIKDFFRTRPGYFRQHMIDQFDEITDTVQLTFAISELPHGSIEINGTRLDPASLGLNAESVLPWKGVYFNNIPIRIKAIPGIGYQFKEWQGIDSTDPEIEYLPDEDKEITAVFEPKTNWGLAVINELFYDVPAEMGGDELFEFVELHNPGTSSYSMSGHYFDQGISFSFPAGSVIPAGSFVVIARDRENYTNLDVPVFQWTAGKLSNTGEALVLKTAEGFLVDSVLYETKKPWPKGTEGTGFSLELINPQDANEREGAWQRSYAIGGTPGSTNSHFTPIPKVFINELYAGDSTWFIDPFGEAEDWVELYNPGDLEVSLGGLWLSDDPHNLTNSVMRSYYPDSVTIPPKGFLRIWLDNEVKQGVTHAGFKLSKDGEGIYLVQADGLTILDQVSFGPQSNNASYGRYPDGGDEWEVMHSPSPTTANVTDYYEIPDIRINEIMAKNYETWENKFGQFEDWIELYNPGSEVVEVGGLYLSNSPDEPLKHRIPIDPGNYTQIQPHGFILLIGDGKPELGVAHLNMMFRSAGGTVYLNLLANQEIICLDSVQYPLAAEGISYGCFPDGSETWIEMANYTPGGPNQQGPSLFDKIYLNEFAAKNYESYPDELGLYEDWIEVYNDNDQAVNLSGLFLTNDPESLDLWKIPDSYPDSTNVQAKSFLIFRADGASIPSVLHADFKLKSSGGFLALMQSTADTWTYIDSTSYPSQNEGESFGRATDGASNWVVFMQPSPGKANGGNTGIHALASPVSSLLVYPNPAQDWLIIESDSFEPFSQIELINLQGQIIYHLQRIQAFVGSQSNVRIQLPPEVKTGIYFLRIAGKEFVEMQRIIIKRSGTPHQ